MCKIFAMTNASKLDLKTDINIIGTELLKRERDGFGYALLGESGVFGEKCIDTTFRTRLNANAVVNLPIIKSVYSRFGTQAKITGPGIFHGRTSTNKLGITNTHPMRMKGWSLIHNGVVTDHGPVYVKKTQNDSEDLLHRLIDGGIEAVAKWLSGYYAFAAIDPDGRLHIGRDNWAPLCMAWSPSHESFIFATNSELLTTLCDDLKIEIGPIEGIKSEHYAIFEANTLKEHTKFTARGYTVAESRYSNASLGYGMYGESDEGWTHGKKWCPIQQKFLWPSQIERNANSVDEITNTTTSETRKLLTASAEFRERESEELAELLHELEYLDDTYSIFDYAGRDLSAAEFRALSDLSKADCFIERSDGTYIDLNPLWRHAVGVKGAV